MLEKVISSEEVEGLFQFNKKGYNAQEGAIQNWLREQQSASSHCFRSMRSSYKRAWGIWGVPGGIDVFALHTSQMFLPFLCIAVRPINIWPTAMWDWGLVRNLPVTASTSNVHRQVPFYIRPSVMAIRSTGLQLLLGPKSPLRLEALPPCSRPLNIQHAATETAAAGVATRSSSLKGKTFPYWGVSGKY